jgi:hypothetical protein
VDELAPLKQRAKSYPVIVGLLLATVIAGASVPAPAGVLKELYAQYKARLESLASAKAPDEAVYQIFSYNAFTLLALSAPFLGPLFAAYAAFSLGLTVKAVAYVEAKSTLALALSLLAAPSTWLYMLSYAIALTESTWLTAAVLQRRAPALELTLALLVLAAALSLLSATLDVSLAALSSRAAP